MHIVVAEQSSLFRRLLEQSLEKLKVSFVSVDDAEALLTVLDQKRADMVVFCADLPGSDNRPFFQQLRRRMFLADSHLILVKNNESSIFPFEEQIGFFELFYKNNFEAFKLGLNAHIHRLEQRFLQGRLLFVEDSDIVSESLGMVFDAHGLEYERFVTVEEALDAFKSRHFDLILSDYYLEGSWTGIDLVRQIRAMGGSKSQTPILVFSAELSTERRIEVLYAGANDYISKPVLNEELIARMSTQLKMHSILQRLEEQGRQLEKMAITDPLTGLFNRSGLRGPVHKALQIAAEQGLDVSAILIDLDLFKQINDVHGHARGDIVLKELGQYLALRLDQNEFGVRLGGEEIVLFQAGSANDLLSEWAWDLCRSIASRTFADLKITVSMGVATFDGTWDHQSLDQIIARADKALYQAKSLGRNQVVFEENIEI